MRNLLNFIKSETVLSIAFVIALISAFFVKPSMDYLSYIDFRTLSLLFCLMTVMAGLKKTGLFRIMSEHLIRKATTSRGVVLFLVMLCFFSSMLITNDVALVTFVPFALVILDIIDKKSLIVPVVALQTVAANLGSMLTPLGNPQNLYLYAKAQIGAFEFMKIMLPYTVVSFILLALLSLCQKNEKVSIDISEVTHLSDKKATAVYLVLFCVCMLTVGRIVHFRITLGIVLAVVVLGDRKILKNVDYSLLLTFAAFFIFVGNMAKISFFSDFLGKITQGKEVISSVLASQVISNVPAALLLSGFTDNYKGLIIGTNLGGLGTLIASMASLISFKCIARENKSLRKKYFVYFTLINTVFLLILLFFYKIY